MCKSPEVTEWRMFKLSERNQYGSNGEGQDSVRESSVGHEGVQFFSKVMRIFERVLNRSTVRCTFHKFLLVAS